MLVYNYDPITKEFLYTQEADPDPVESKRQGEFIPLLPANSTLVEVPKTKENEAAIFSEGSWVIVKDYRDKALVDKELNITYIDEFGKPDGILIDKDLALEIEENPSLFEFKNKKVVKKSEKVLLKEELENFKNLKIKEASDKASEFIESGKALFELRKGKSIEATSDNIGKFTSLMVTYITGERKETDRINWTTHEDEVINLTKTQIAKIIKGLNDVQSNVWNEKYTQFVDEINKCKNIEELSKINIEY